MGLVPIVGLADTISLVCVLSETYTIGRKRRRGAATRQHRATARQRDRSVVTLSIDPPGNAPAAAPPMIWTDVLNDVCGDEKQCSDGDADSSEEEEEVACGYHDDWGDSGAGDDSTGVHDQPDPHAVDAPIAQSFGPVEYKVSSAPHVHVGIDDMANELVKRAKKDIDHVQDILKPALVAAGLGDGPYDLDEVVRALVDAYCMKFISGCLKWVNNRLALRKKAISLPQLVRVFATMTWLMATGLPPSRGLLTTNSHGYLYKGVPPEFHMAYGTFKEVIDVLDPCDADPVMSQDRKEDSQWAQLEGLFSSLFGCFGGRGSWLVLGDDKSSSKRSTCGKGVQRMYV